MKAKAIELTLTIKQARKLVRALAGETGMNNVEDPDLAVIHDEVSTWASHWSMCVGGAPDRKKLKE